VRLALIVPGGVDRSAEERIIPALLWLVRRLRRCADLTIFALHQEPRRCRFTLCGVPVENIGLPFTSIRAVATLLAAHRARPFDLVHAFWAGAPGEVAVTVAAMIDRPVLVHVAGGELVSLPDIGYGGCRTRGARLRRRLVIRRADAITAASASVITAVHQFGREALRVPLGAGIEDWPPQAPRPRDPARLPRLLHVGSLNRVKDQTTMLRALALLADRGVRFQLDIVGQDTLGGAVERAVYELGLSSAVTFHGFMTQHELRPLVERADLLIVSSRHEAGPVVLSEAALAGVPTVGTSVGQIQDWAPDAAVAVPIGDVDALAHAIKVLVEDDARRLAVATAAQLRARREDADWTAGRFREIYHRLVNREGRSA
jgi:glycosyltransferase involved in cell wall biosynthesis